MRIASCEQKTPASEPASLAIAASRSQRSPRSNLRAALSISRLAPSTCVTMSASLSWIAWCSQIGLPKALRSCA